MKEIRVALAQINPTVGDLKGNKRKILSSLNKLEKYKPDLVLFPELALSGYPPEDLVLKPHFREDCMRTLEEIAKRNNFDGIVVLGYIEEDKEGDVYNSTAIIYKNEVRASYRKIHLPNYGVFDEKRYFKPGWEPLLINIDGLKIGLTICEDIWVEYGPYVIESLSGVQLLVNVSASPYHKGKIYQRIDLLRGISKKYDLKIAYVNLVGGQDELVFDGASMVLENGEVKAVAKQFDEDLLIYDFSFRDRKVPTNKGNVRQIRVKLPERGNRPKLKKRGVSLLDDEEEVYNALVLGTRDYVKKNGFKRVVIGLSGGIDSSLTCVIAVDALGKDNVIGVSMPSMFSSESSMTDAEKLARNLGIELLKIPINEIYDAYIKTLRPVFGDLPFDKTEENIQARIRGNILMALSNKFGWLVLTTGNKSEVSTGYCTLYGDMAGGFAVIKDVPKTLVYRLAKWRNERGGYPLIPEEVFKKAPSAELRPGQTDQDTLPPYEVLDEIIHLYIEDDKSLDEIIEHGFNKTMVKRVIEMIDKNEYKRRQAPPGIKITPKAFGKDRRMPITNKYKL